MSGSRPHRNYMRHPNLRVRFTNRLLILCAAISLALPCLSGQISHLQAAARFLDQGDSVRAESEARLALRSPETKPLALAMLGTIRLQQSKYTDSVEFLNQALLLNPLQVRIYAQARADDEQHDKQHQFAIHKSPY